jgi:hydroxypyruvate reductase
LAAAQAIAGHAELILLAAGTDGRDGASEDAGAIVDGGTAGRATDAGLDPAAALAAADSGPLLEATGDLLYTGPTGTNVGDVVMALRSQPADFPRM